MVKHIVDTRQLKDREFLAGLFELADEMKSDRRINGIVKKHEGKVVGSFFYQPSTRTKTTFDTAAKRLGAQVVGTENAREFSSAFKGETLEHSLRAIQDCFDLVVMRHHESGAAARAASVLGVPFVNAGDGTNQHPTQALLDLYTIMEKFGRMDSLRVAFVGDVIHGRTIKSLAYLLAHLRKNSMIFVAPKMLALPADMRDYLVSRGVEFSETEDMEKIIEGVDVLYDTRLQFEYLKSEQEKKHLTQVYSKFQITGRIADMMKDDSIIMHPLPINREKSDGYPEITPEVDDHPRAHYFKQSNNGLYVRMALLDILLTGDRHPLYDMILDVP